MVSARISRGGAEADLFEAEPDAERFEDFLEARERRAWRRLPLALSASSAVLSEARVTTCR